VAACWSISRASSGATGGRLCRDGLFGDLIERPAQAAGVLGLVLRIEPAKHLAAALVDQMDCAQVPAGETDLDLEEMTITVGQLEAAALDHQGPVALALGPPLGPREGQPQRRAVRARPRHLGASEEAGDRRLADLGMKLAIVLVLRPGLGRLVEHGEREVRHVLQHGDQPAFDRAPERLLLGVLIGAVRQRGLVQDAEPSQTFGDLRRRHRSAVVAQRGARQAALLERLRQPMRDVLGGLRQVPLQVTGQPRAIVENAEQDRRAPLAARGEDLARSIMAIPVPEAVDVLGLVATHLAVIEPRLRTLGAGGPPRRSRPPPVQAVCVEEAAQCRVGRHRPKRGLLRRERDQVVVVKLGAPALVRGILGKQRLAQGVAHRRLAAGVPAALAA